MKVIHIAESEWNDVLKMYVTVREVSTLYDGEVAECKGGGTSQTVQKADPWAGVQPYMKDVFKQAQDVYRNDRPEFYPNDTFIEYSPQSMLGFNMMQGNALSNPLPATSTAQHALTNAGGYLEGNPYINNAVSSMTGDVMSRVNDTFNKGGRFGSGQHAATIAKEVGDVSGRMRMDNYQNERENMMRSLALTPQAYQLSQQPSMDMMKVGAGLEGKEQEKLNADIQRHQFNENQRQDALQWYNNLLTGGMNFGQTTQTNPTSGGNPLMGAIGGGLLGYGAGSTIAALNPYTMPLAAGGALLGGLGLFD